MTGLRKIHRKSLQLNSVLCERIKMNLYRNLKIGMILFFLTILLTGCCGPCFAPCNPFHKDKTPEEKQLSTEITEK